MSQFLVVEARIALVHAWQIEKTDDFRDRHFFPIIPGIPAEQTEEIYQRLRQVATALIFLDEGALITLGHFARTILFQNEGDVSIDRHRRSKRFKELHMFAGV